MAKYRSTVPSAKGELVVVSVPDGSPSDVDMAHSTQWELIERSSATPDLPEPPAEVHTTASLVDGEPARTLLPAPDYVGQAEAAVAGAETADAGQQLLDPPDYEAIAATAPVSGADEADRPKTAEHVEPAGEEVDIDKMRKPQLVEKLAELSLDTDGNVPVLRERLREALDSGTEAVAGAETADAGQQDGEDSDAEDEESSGSEDEDSTGDDG